MRKILLKEAIKPVVDLSSNTEYQDAKKEGLANMLKPFKHAAGKSAIDSAFNDVAKRLHDTKDLSDLKAYAEALTTFKDLMDTQLSSSEITSFKRASKTLVSKYKTLAPIFGREQGVASKEGHEKTIEKHLEKANSKEAKPLSLRKLRGESYNWKNRVKFYLGEY